MEPPWKRRRREAPPLTRESRLLKWLRSRGAVLDGVDLRDDAYGGLGVFASGRTFAAGDVAVLDDTLLDPSRELAKPRRSTTTQSPYYLEG